MKLILVGLDASERAPAVLRAAIDLAQRTSAKLILFRAIGIPHEVPADAYTMSPATLADRLDRDARLYLEEVAGTCPPGVVADRVVQMGVAWQALCSAGERLGVDLILLGSHGYSGLDRLLGTTAAKVVNHAKQSVLVVRGLVVDEEHRAPIAGEGSRS